MRWAIILMFLTGQVYGIGLSCKDPSTILCLFFEDGNGSVVSDSSKSGLTATINGGPAWATQLAGMSGWSSSNYSVSITSDSTFAQVPPHYLYFVGTSGEDVTTPVTDIFNLQGFSFMIMIIIIPQNLVVGSISPINFTQGGNSCGWDLETIYTSGDSYVSFTYPGKAEHRMNVPNMFSRKAHSYGLWKDTSGNMDLYFDGKLNTSFSGQLDMSNCGGGSELAIAKIKTGASTEYSGGVGPIQIWGSAIPRFQAAAFFKAWHDSFFGR